MTQKIPENYFQLTDTTELVKYSNAWNAYYYSTNPIMTDEEFDKFEVELFREGYRDLIEAEKRRIFNLQGDEHISISLDKVKEKDIDKNIFFDLQKWFFKHKINYREKEFFIAPKFDGGSLKLTLDYQQNIERIITRGGKDYTEILSENQSIKDLINHLKQSKKHYRIITGELLVKKSIFEEKYSDKLKNPRNAVNSLINSKDIKTINDLTFIPLTDGTNAINEINNRVIWSKLPTDKFLSLKQIYQQYKYNLDYLIDGIVITFRVKQRIVKDNYPLNMVALKFKSEGKQTEVIDIEWTKKKTGKLTPVLKLKPIMLDGAEISSVSAYNYHMLVEELKAGVGSIIEIRKGDDIVPKWTKTIKPSVDFRIPDNTEVVGKYLFYKNDDNSKQKFILGLNLLELEGIGPKNAEKIGSLSFINFDIIELFNPKHKSKFVEIFGYNAMINNLFKIYEIKTIPLNLLINILQFNGCGDILSMKFAKMLTKIEPFNRANIDENVFDYVILGEGREIISKSIKRLKEFGIKVIKPIQHSDETISFEMTGNPPSMTKREFVNHIKQIYPSAIHTTLTKNTEFLITNDINSNTSKMNKARKYNVKIVSYSDVIKNGFPK